MKWRLPAVGAQVRTSGPGTLIFSAAAKLLYAKKKGDRVQLAIAFQQRVGNFNVLRQGAVELAPR